MSGSPIRAPNLMHTNRKIDWIAVRPLARRMLKACLWIICLLSADFSVSGFSPQNKENLELRQALDKMDEVAKHFRTFTAKFSQKKYTAVLGEFDTPDTGEFYYARPKEGEVLMRHEVMSPGSRILTIKDGEATVYQPKLKQAQIYKLGKRQELVEYLALGIGRSSAELREKFLISCEGSASIGGASCFILVFKPKDPKVARHITSITIWLSKSSGLPLQYKILEPSEDYLLETFSDEALNEKIPGSMFEAKLPKGVQKLRLQ
jgi:outer membrane lipoprotein-sorting protein